MKQQREVAAKGMVEFGAEIESPLPTDLTREVLNVHGAAENVSPLSTDLKRDASKVHGPETGRIACDNLRQGKTVAEQ